MKRKKKHFREKSGRCFSNSAELWEKWLLMMLSRFHLVNEIDSGLSTLQRPVTTQFGRGGLSALNYYIPLLGMTVLLGGGGLKDSVSTGVCV